MHPGSAATADFTVQSPSFSPSSVPITQTFTFSVTLKPSVSLSNVNIALDIKNPALTQLLLKQTFSAQNFTAGTAVTYTWTGHIPNDSPLGVAFTAGDSYDVLAYVFNSNYTSQYLSAALAATFTVTGTPTDTDPQPYYPPTTNVGFAATPPIALPVGRGKTIYVSDANNPSVNAANLKLLPSGATVYPTLQAAANVTNPGDTVEIMNGTYEPDPSTYVPAVLDITRSGSAGGGYITYKAYPGHHPVVTTSNSTNVFDTIDIQANYIVIAGLNVVGYAQNLTLDAANQIASDEEALLKQEAEAGEPETYPASAEKNASNENCIAGDLITHIILSKNLIHDCSGAGIDFEEVDYVTIETNTVYNAAWWSLYDTSGINLHFADNSDSSTGYKIYVLDNAVYDNANAEPYLGDQYNNDVSPGSAPTTPTDGNGIIIDTNETTNTGTPYLGRALIAGNIAYGNGGAGVVVYLSNHIDMVYNNAYLNDSCPISGSTCGAINKGQLLSLSGSDINILDNVLYAPSGNTIYTTYNNSNISENYNIFYGPGVSPTYTGNGEEKLQNLIYPSANDVVGNPVFADTANPSSDYFEFAAGSPGIYTGSQFSNEGVSVSTLLGLKVSNSAVSIGSRQ